MKTRIATLCVVSLLLVASKTFSQGGNTGIAISTPLSNDPCGNSGGDSGAGAAESGGLGMDHTPFLIDEPSLDLSLLRVRNAGSDDDEGIHSSGLAQVGPMPAGKMSFRQQGPGKILDHKTAGYGKAGQMGKVVQKYGITRAGVGKPLASDTEICGNYAAGTVTLTGGYRLFRQYLAIEGKDIDWRFSCFYQQSEAASAFHGPFDSHFGNGWAFTYADQLDLTNLNVGAVKLFESGRLRVTEWSGLDGNGFFSTLPANENSRLYKNQDGSFDRIELDGTVWHFNNQGMLTILTARSGASMQFLHGENGAPSDALTSILDTYGRLIQYQYFPTDPQAPGYVSYKAGKLKKVVDFASREISFDYNSDGNLISVITPVVTQTYSGGSNTFPNGKKETFTYVQDSASRWALEKIFRPNENNANYGEDADNTPLIVNQYSGERVISQQRGPNHDVENNSRTNTLSYSYTSITDTSTQMTDFDGNKEDTPAFKASITDRNGNVKSYFIAFGSGALTRAEVNETNVLEGSTLSSTATLITRYQYTTENQLAKTTFPDGRIEEIVYDSATDPQLPVGSNPISIIYHPGTHKDPITNGTVFSDQGTRTVTYTYEPIFNQPLTMTDERGNDSNFAPDLSGPANSDRYKTQYFYDYMEGDQSSIQTLANQYHRAITSTQKAALAKNQDLNGDNLTNQKKGNLIKVQHPSVILESSSPQATIEGGTNQSIVNLIAYNSFGQLLFDVDPEGNISQYVYYPETDPDGDGTATPNFSGNTSTGGFLKKVIRDASVPSGANSSLFPVRRETAPLVAAETQMKYDVVGNQTQFIDALGVIYQYDRNSRNQVYRSLLAQGSSLEQEIRFEYDANDNLIRRFVKNSISPAGTWVEEQIDYDLEDQVIRHRGEISQSGGSSTFAEQKFAFDGNGNLRKRILPEGNTIQYSYNARDQQTLIHRAPGSSETSRTELSYDKAGNLVRTTQHTEGTSDVLLQSYLILDGYNRLVGSVDPVGARVTLVLDPVGNPILSMVEGYPNGASPTSNSGSSNITLTNTAKRYDELNRVYQLRRDVFNDSSHASETGTTIVQKFVFDRASRQAFYIEFDGDTYETQYDGRNRAVRHDDPLGNFSTSLYDENDNLLEVTEGDVATISGVATETFTTTMYYDALNRLTQVGDNLGNTRRFYYDTQNNLIKVSDANGPLPLNLPRHRPELGTYIANLDGNVVNFFYDGLNRMVKKDVLLTSTGRGDGTTNPTVDTSQSGDGIVRTQTVFDKNSRVKQQIDDKGNITQNNFDLLNRVTQVIYGLSTSDQSSESFVFDGADRLIQHTDQNGSVIQSSYDLASRLTNKLLASAASGVISTPEQRFEYDGLGRMTKSTDLNSGTWAVVENSFDSLSRLYKEQESYGSASSSVESFWANGNLRTSLKYPNNRSLPFTYDSLNRVKTLDTNYSYDFIGKGRVLERTSPNGTKLSYLSGSNDVGYDGVRRILKPLSYKMSGSTTLTSFEYTYDREHHRKTVRRHHEMNGSNAKGEFYDYDSAYRLIDWKSGTLVKTGSATVPLKGGDYTTNNSGSALPFTVTTLQDGGYPLSSFTLNLSGSANDSQNWTLDGAGNWTGMTRNGSSSSNTLTPLNEYLSFGGVTQTHDANGNLKDDGTYLYGYDFLNRLREVKLKSNSQVIAQYDYDCLNRRVYKSSSIETARYLYDGWHAIEERNSSNQVVKQFVYGERLDEILEMDIYSSGSIQSRLYYHSDALGSVVGISDNTGSLVERVKYSPYGQPYFMDASNNLLLDGSGNFLAQSSVGNPLLFTAARYDAETSVRTASVSTDRAGKYYLRNRYQDPNKGRFITRDPIGIWGDNINLGNGYGYCGNDPVNCEDPLGLRVVRNCPEDDEAKKKKEELIKKLASGAFRETSGLRPQWKDPKGEKKKENYDPKSAEDLHKIRKAIAQALQNGARIQNDTSPSEEELKNPDAKAAWEDCLKAAEEALDNPDPALGKDTKHFYLRSLAELVDNKKGSKPSWAIGVKPVQTIGPVRNAAGGGDVPKGDVWVDFYRGIK